jgi:hypothetical protein
MQVPENDQNVILFLDTSVVVADLGVIEGGVALFLGTFIGVPKIFSSLKLFKMFCQSTIKTNKDIRPCLMSIRCMLSLLCLLCSLNNAQRVPTDTTSAFSSTIITGFLAHSYASWFIRVHLACFKWDSSSGNSTADLQQSSIWARSAILLAF